MTASFALWLPVGAIGLYLYDSMLLLHANEVALEHRGRGWRLHVGADMLLGGRRPYLPAPWRPTAPLYLGCWTAAASVAPAGDPEALARFERGLAPLRPLVAGLGALLLVALPLVCLVWGAGLPLLLLFAAYYGLVVALLVLVHLRREALGLSPKAYALLCVDALACAPFAVNAVRKLAWRRALVGEPLAFAGRELAGTERERALALLARQVELRLRDEGDEERAAALADYLERVRSLRP